MIRPGYFNKASMTRTGDLPSGIGSKANRPGIRGGGVVIGFVFGLEKEMMKCAPDGFVKISAQRIVAEKLHRQCGRTDKGPKIPGQLRAEKEIAREPTE